MEILERRYADPCRHPVWVFPKQEGSGPIWSLDITLKSVLDRSGIKDLRIHDLRRTAGSYMAIEGISPIIIGKALGHRSPASTAIYARLTQDPVRQALEKAQSALSKFQAPEPEPPKNNVVEFRQKLKQ